MSEIAGIVCLTSGARAAEECLVSMLQAMKTSVASSIETYVMGNNRAAIGRIAYGTDKNCVQNEGVVESSCRVFCVGEIYNDDIANVDCSADYIFRRYCQKDIEDFAEGLNGSFAAVIADSHNGSVTLVTDHTASCPLFITIHGDKLYFASEVKAIAAVKDIPCEPDPASVLSLTVRDFFVLRRTLLESVRQMDYATVCHIEKGNVRHWSYWRYAIEGERDRGIKTCLTDFTDLLRQAVKRRTRSGRGALLLSGGIDSRGILCCVDDPSSISAVTYTHRNRSNRHKRGDWAVAEQVARRLGLDYFVVHIDGRDFSQALIKSVFASDGAAGFVYESMIWEDVRQRTKADYLLKGDECMGWGDGPVLSSRILPPLAIYNLKGQDKLQRLLRDDKLASFIEKSESDLTEIMRTCSASSPYDRVDELYLQQRLIHCVIPKGRIVRRYGIQVRNPWLDLDILDFVRRLPLRYRRGKSLFRKSLWQLNPSLCQLPVATEGESIDFGLYLREAELNENLVSNMVLLDNPLLEEFFDISAIHEFIAELRRTEIGRKSSVRFNPKALLPPSIRGKVRTLYYIMNPNPKLSGTKLLLRIATVAVALRCLHHRFEVTV